MDVERIVLWGLMEWCRKELGERVCEYLRRRWLFWEPCLL